MYITLYILLINCDLLIFVMFLFILNSEIEKYKNNVWHT